MEKEFGTCDRASATDSRSVAVARNVAEFIEEHRRKTTEQHFLEKSFNPMDYLTTLIKRVLYLPDRSIITIAAWILFSWKYQCFDFAPILFLHSPTKRCGKTTAEELLEKLVPNPLFTSNTSSAVLFRLLDSSSYTVLIDEFDSFGKKNDDLRNILNAGYRNGGVVMRCEGKDGNFRPRTFKVFGPKVIAAIGHLPDTLMDRAITIRMERMPDGEKREKLRTLNSECEDARALCELWAETIELPIAVELPDSLHSRQQDSWEPLFCVAKTCGDRWLTETYRAAEVLCSDFVEETQDSGSQLLGDVYSVVVGDEVDEETDIDSRGKCPPILSGPEICNRLNELKDAPYSYWNDGKGITSSALAKKLRPFNLSTKVRQKTRGYLWAEIEQATKQYLPHLFKTVVSVASVVSENENGNSFLKTTDSSVEILQKEMKALRTAWEIEQIYGIWTVDERMEYAHA